MDINVYEIEHVLVPSTKNTGRFALNHEEGTELFTRARVEVFHDRFWHEGRVDFDHDRNAYVFRFDGTNLALPLKAGMLVRIPEPGRPF